MSSEKGARLRGMVEDLYARREVALAMGGPEKVALQHEMGKRTARERLELLFDPETFRELGILAKHLPNPTLRGKQVFTACWRFCVMLKTLLLSFVTARGTVK